MSSAVTGKGVPVKVSSRSIRLSVLRLVRMAVAFVVVAGSLGLATVTATAQSGGVGAVLNSSCPSDGATAYSDVAESSFAYDDSRCLRELGISGADDTYRPGDDMTRSEMAAFIANAYAVLTGMEAPIQEHMFDDVEDDPNAEDIARISPNGLMITTGTSDTTYSPDDLVLRGHMALFLTRLYKAATGDDAPAGGDTGFTDIGDRSAEEQASIAQLYALKVTTGTSETTYSPTTNVTREQMASFVARMYRAIDAAIDALAEPPGAPTGVEVAISGEAGDSLDVSWTAPEDEEVTGYVVQWKSGDDDFSDDNERSVRGASTSFEDLTLGETYSFRVAAENDAGQGDWSDEASANPAVAPGLVGDLKSKPGNETLTLTWTYPAEDGGSEITSYVVSWRLGRDPAAGTAEVSGDALTYTITGLDNSERYSVWVQAVNAAGAGGQAAVPAETGATTRPSPTPGSTVQNLKAVPGDEDLTLTWTERADTGGTSVVNYTIQQRCGTDTAFTESTGSPQAHVPTSQVQTFLMSGLTNGDACEVQVRANTAVDSDEDGNLSDETADESGPWAKISGTPATNPDAPTGVVVNPAHQSLQVMWLAPAENGGSDITGYKLTWSAGIEQSMTVPAEPTSYLITGLNNAYNYSVTLETVTEAGESDATTAVVGSPLPVPDVPTNVAAAPPPVVAGQAHSGTSLVVTWSAPAPNGTRPVTGYDVQYRTSAVIAADGSVTTPAGNWSNALDPLVSASGKLTHTFTGLTQGTSYDVRVQAFNDHDNKADTDPVGGPWATATATPATLPAAVADAGIANESGYTSIQVAWTAPADNGSDITHYLLRYALADENSPWISGSEGIRINPTSGTAFNRYRIDGLSTGQTYITQVRAVNGIGIGEWSREVEGTPLLVPDAPTSVTAIPEPNGDGSKLRVSWPRVTNNGSGRIDGYRVEVRDVTSTDQPNGGWVSTTVQERSTVFSPGTTWSSAVLSVDVTNGVTSGMSYLVRVRATAGSNTNGVFAYAEGEGTKAASTPAASVLGTVTAVSVENTNNVRVNWTGVAEMALATTDITGYVVSWFDSMEPVSGNRGSTTVTGAGSDSYVVTGLAPGTYTVTVSAVNAVGTGAAATAATPPVVPQPS